MQGIQYKLLTKQIPSITTEVLAFEEGDLTFGIFLDRSVPDGMSLQAPEVHYMVDIQTSEDGNVWSSVGGFGQYGGAMLSGSGTADDPYYVTQYDGTTGSIQPGTRFLRAVITGSEMTGNTPIGIFGFMSSSPNEDQSIGWPEG
jgi:hypothetical protein